MICSVKPSGVVIAHIDARSWWRVAAWSISGGELGCVDMNKDG